MKVYDAYELYVQGSEHAAMAQKCLKANYGGNHFKVSNGVALKRVM